MNDKLAQLIKDNNVEVATMARDIKCSRNTIYRAIRGERSSGEFMLKVAAYFDKEISEIFFTPIVQQIEQKRKLGA